VREYLVAAPVAAVAVVLVEVRWLRTGLFRDRTYWLAMAIVIGFQVLVDGWLTKLSAPIVRYDPSEFSGVRFPWDVPVEDYLFGFALVTLVTLLWERAGGRTLDGDRS
jgi:lycopene cyclase domain-containing protein